MIEYFKAFIVANSQPWFLVFDCHDHNVPAPTVPMCDLKMILAIAAANNNDIELFHCQLDPTTEFVSAQLQLAGHHDISCNPSCYFDIHTDGDGFLRVWKLTAPLHGTWPAAIHWYYWFWCCFLAVFSLT